jgi:hypothetical protein
MRRLDKGRKDKVAAGGCWWVERIKFGFSCLYLLAGEGASRPTGRRLPPILVHVLTLC